MTSAARTLVLIGLVAVVGAAIVAGGRIFDSGDGPPAAGALAPKGRMVNFRCTDRSGREMDTASFAGKFTVADFVFTSCSGMCPALAENMRTVQEATRGSDDVRIVSFSVDPERDRLPVMAKYADEHGFDPERWLFVRSDIEDLKKLMVDELHLVNSTDPVLHTDCFVLFDRAGAARGVYAPLEDPEWRTKLLADLGRLRASPN